MKVNLLGPFTRNRPFGTESAFAKGLRNIGVDVVEVDYEVDPTIAELDYSADATVVFKSCVGSEQYLERFAGAKIVYQPDDARFGHIKQLILDARYYCDHFLSFDDYGAEFAKSVGYSTARTMLLTADTDLYRSLNLERDIDVSFVGNMSHPAAHESRRHMWRVTAELAKEHGWKIHFTTNNNVGVVNEIYNRSKVVLNHATDLGQNFGTGFGVQCRHFEVGMAGACLLSNKIIPNDRFNIPFVGFEDEATLKQRLITLVNDDEIREGCRLALSHDMIRHTPEARADELRRFIESII